MDPHNQDNVTPAALLEQLVYVDTFMPEIDDPSALDERLTAELSAFADDEFVFPDEEKPQQNNNDVKDDILDRFHHINSFPSHNQGNNNNNGGRNHDVKQFNTLQSSSFSSGISNVLSPLSSLQSSSSASHQTNQLNNSLNNTNNHINNTNNNQGNEGSRDLLLNLPKVTVPPGAQSSLIAAGLSQTQIDALAALVAQHQGTGTESSGNNNNNNSNNNNSNNNNNQERHSVSLSNGLSEFGNDEFLGNSVNPTVTTSNHNSVSSTNSGSPLNFQSGSIKFEPSGDVDMDKRKRNTAASARFRIKKKLKEQELERTVRELNELTMTLEKKIQTLEMENKLLRNLVVEKGEQRNNEELANLKKKVRLETSNNVGNIEFSNQTPNF